MSVSRAYPKFRRDLVVRRVVESGDVAWTVHDPLRNSYFRHDPMTHELCELLDGENDADAILNAMEARYPQYTFTQEWLDELTEDLRRGGFLEDTFRMNEIQRARAKEARRKWAPQSLKNLLNIQFGVVDPSNVFRFVYPVARVLFTRTFVLCAVFAFFCAVGLLWDRRDALVGGLGTIFTLSNSNVIGLVLLWTILFLIVVAHEFGHGLSCVHFGGQPRRLGFMLFYLMPGMFCDVSDIYFFEKRWHRAAVALAGGYVELLCFTSATFIWVATQPGLLLHDIAYRVMLFSGATGLIFNYNPLIKLDGYYVLMSWLDIPDFRERSFKYIGDLFRGKILRLPVEPERLTRRERRAMLLYGAAAIAYSTMYTWIMVLFLRHILTANFREAGMLAFLVFLVFFLKKHVIKLWAGTRYLVLEKAGRAKSSFAVLAAAVVLVVAALLVPLPHRVTVNARLEPIASRIPTAPFDGTVERVLVRPGDAVRRGTVLAVVQPADGAAASRLGADDRTSDDGDAFAEARVTALGAEAAAGRARRDMRDGRPIEVSHAEYATAGATARTAAERRDQGWIVSPVAGRVLDLSPGELAGAPVVAGDPLFHVGDVESLCVVLDVSEREVVDLAVGGKADLRLYAAPSVRARFVLDDIDRAPRLAPALEEPVTALVDTEKPAQTFRARGRIGNADGALRPGMSGRVRVDGPPLSVVARIGRAYARIVRADFWL